MSELYKEGIYGHFSSLGTKREANVTMRDMVIKAFPGDQYISLRKTLHLFLASCKQKQLLPSKIAWQQQLELLKELPTLEAQENQVNNAIIKGWRSVAFHSNKSVKNVSTETKQSMQKVEETF